MNLLRRAQHLVWPSGLRADTSMAAGAAGKAVLLALLFGASTVSPAQTLAATRSTIGLEQVVAALNEARLPLEGAEVRLLAQNIAMTADPKLEVRGLEPWGDRAARVRMGCEAHAQCVPFYVGVDWTDATLAKAALHPAIALGASSVSNASQARRGTYAGSPAPASSKAQEMGKQAADAAANPEASVHAGTRATLLLDGERTHIKVPVICLENGGPGRTIRAAALDHKQTYHAEVVDSTLLKGTL